VRLFDVTVDRGRAVAAIVCVTVGVAFTIAVAEKGIPALRHDWQWPNDRAGFLANAWDSFGGWTSTGFGQVQSHPTSAIVIALTAAIVALLGPLVGLILYVFAIGLFIAIAAWRTSSVIADDVWIQAGCAVFATFNPWVYTELVAGHLGMLLAYAALVLLAGELLRARPNPYVAALATLFTAQQVQIFLIVALTVVLCAVRNKALRMSALAAILMMLPLLIVTIGDFSSFLNIPYTLEWQRLQSVDPKAALLLHGYFAGYTEGFPRISRLGSWLTLAFCGFGAIAIFRRHQWRLLIFAFTGALVAWLCATGVKGVAGPMYAWLVLNVPETGAFRELYDLLAFAAAGYVVLVSAGARFLGAGAPLWTCTALLIATAWITNPPAGWWVGSDEIPATAFEASPHTRFALMPPFQPLSYRGAGSGIDPEEYARPGNITPLNADTEYPVDVALARYWQYRDPSALEALGVSAVVPRAFLRGDRRALAAQAALPKTPSLSEGVRSQNLRLQSAPEVSLGPVPEIDVLPGRFGLGHVLFGDAAGLHGPGIPTAWRELPSLRAVHPPTRFTHASEGWVNVSQAFRTDPDLGQGIGGALTTSETAMLPVHGDDDALVFVRGELLAANGLWLSGSTHGYRWIRLPTVTNVRCAGLCVVAGESAKVPPARGTSSNRGGSRSIDFETFAPWLFVTALPANAENSTLRLNVRYDPSWFGFSGRTLFVPLRLDSTTNGWIIPAHARPERVVVFSWIGGVIAALQIFELAFALSILAALLADASSPVRGHAGLTSRLPR
jgi:hypothetical protein